MPGSENRLNQIKKLGMNWSRTLVTAKWHTRGGQGSIIPSHLFLVKSTQFKQKYLDR